MALNLMMKASRNLALMKIRQSVEAVYKQHRLVFKDEEKAEYADKDGIVKTYTIDELATHLWFAMDSQLIKGSSVSLVVLNIADDDVKQIIMKIPRRIMEAKK
jgi:hypothetical protein